MVTPVVQENIAAGICTVTGTINGRGCVIMLPTVHQCGEYTGAKTMWQGQPGSLAELVFLALLDTIQLSTRKFLAQQS